MQMGKCQIKIERGSMKQLEMVGFQKLHSPVWACNLCDRLSSHPDVDALFTHLKEVHGVSGVSTDADGGAWITETTN